MKQNLMASVLMALLVLSVMGSLGVIGHATAIKNTWMIYSCGDNNLEGDENLKLDLISWGGGSTDEVTIVTMADRVGTVNDGIYYIKAGGAGTFPSGDDKVWTPPAELDMSDPANLVFFINYVTTSYPSDRYILDISDHGGGYRDDGGMRGVMYDDHPDRHLDIPVLAATLRASGVHFDLCYFDACMMDMAEVGYEIRDSANVMVASEQTTYERTPYHTIIPWLRSNPGASAEAIGEQIVTGYVANAPDNQEMASIDLAQMPAVATSMDSLGDLLNANMPVWQSDILAASGATQHFKWPEYADIYDFMDQLDARINNPQLQAATLAVRNDVDQAVLSEAHKGTGVANSHGLSTWKYGGMGFARSDFKILLQEYQPLEFAADTSWDEFNIELMKVPTILSGLVANPASPYVGRDFTLSGKLTAGASSTWNELVQLQKWDGISWTDIPGKTSATGWDGTFTFIMKENAAATYRYRAHYPGNDDVVSDHLFFGTDSDPADITVQKIPTSISALTADPASPSALHEFTLIGTMTSDGSPVVGETVSLQKWDGASWTATGLTANTGADGTFTFTTKEDAAGDYSYRAHFPEGAVFLGDDSEPLSVTVLKIPTVLSVPVPSSATPLINTPFTLTGTLTADGTGLTGKTVKLWTSTDSGVTWTDTTLTAQTAAGGSYSFTITETVAGSRSYKVKFGPDPAYADSESTSVTVRINRAPDVSLAQASVGWLWSPNHEFVMESVTGVTDPDGDPVTITIMTVTSDEATATAKGAGGAKSAPDAYKFGGNSAQVRSERSGDYDGRVYAISFTADDGFGGVTPGVVKVKVPVDKKTPCVDSGQKFDATKVN
jgi:hypothetical protein